MILVTGADGFIGSHLVEHLVEQGSRVRALVLYNSFNDWGWLDTLDKSIQNQIEVVAGDVRDYESVRSALRGCEAVAHLAALVAIPYSFVSPNSYVDTNVTGTLNIVKAARELELSRVLHTSTSEVYGTARFVPMTEEHPLSAQSPYAASKIGADQIALSFQHAFGTPVTIVRPFNTFGPRQSARAVIPTIISQIASGERRVKLGALHPTRDFTYVRDTVRGMAAALEADAVVGEVINLGSGFEIAIGELAALIAQIMGADVEVVVDPTRLRPAESEVDRLYADSSKARSLLGWEATRSGGDGMRADLADTIKWFQQPENLARYKPQLYNL